MREDTTDITVVLDRSGSMQSVRADTIGGFNTWLDGQKKLPGKANFTMVQFNTVYEFLYNGIDIQTVPELTTITYAPIGLTALLDALGRAIAETGARLDKIAEADRPSKVLFVVITDGEENSSQEYKHPQVMEMIKHQRETYNWGFVFLGANQDAIQAGVSFGMAAGASMSFKCDPQGMKQAFAALSTGTAMCRASASGAAYAATVDNLWSDEDRAKNS